MRAKGARKGFLHEILGPFLLFCQMKGDAVEMVEISHGFTRKRFPLSNLACFLPGHEAILDKGGTPVYLIKPVDER